VGTVQPEPQPTELLNRPAGRTEGRIQILQDSTWQMSFGERAAIEGILSQLSPKLAIEIGTAEGGSLARVAAHSREVHSFDLVPPGDEARGLGNVTFHTGDSHVLLPQLLARFADERRNVDFVLVDGDHSTDGVHQDMRDLLDSHAVAQSIILAHDTANPTVRAGLDRVHYAAYPKVAYVELDFVAGYMFREPSLLHELWGGLGLVVVDSARGTYYGDQPGQARYFEAFDLLSRARAAILDEEDGRGTARRLDQIESELRVARESLDSMQSSVSWRVTAPLRALKSRWMKPADD
jgi:hypothetical protein